MSHDDVIIVKVLVAAGNSNVPGFLKTNHMQTIKELLKKEKTVVIDVRNDWEYQEDHISGALNIPLHEIPAQIGKIKNLQGPFILYCRSGNRSGAAVNILKQAGIKDVFNGGGIDDMEKTMLN